MENPLDIDPPAPDLAFDEAGCPVVIAPPQAPEPGPDATEVCEGCGKSIPASLRGDALCVQCRYDGHHKPAESGEPSEFDIAVETVAAPERRADAEQDQAHAVAGHVLGEFIRRLCADGDALTAGRRLMLLAYLAGQLECSTNRELARKLKVSPGRVSQLMAELPEDFASLMRLKRRAIKGRHPIERNNLE